MTSLEVIIPTRSHPASSPLARLLHPVNLRRVFRPPMFQPEVRTLRRRKWPLLPPLWRRRTAPLSPRRRYPRSSPTTPVVVEVVSVEAAASWCRNWTTPSASVCNLLGLWSVKKVTWRRRRRHRVKSFRSPSRKVGNWRSGNSSSTRPTRGILVQDTFSSTWSPNRFSRRRE